MPYFKVPMIGQANSNCCWLACYQMLYGYRGRDKYAPYKRARSAGISTTSTLYSNKWRKARDAMGLTSYRVSYLTEDWDNLKWVLDSSGPMWCAGAFLNGSGHAVVISGYKGETLRINDPYEIYKYHSYDYMTYGKWRKLVRNQSYACQVWP